MIEVFTAVKDIVEEEKLEWEEEKSGKFGGNIKNDLFGASKESTIMSPSQQLRCSYDSVSLSM